MKKLSNSKENAVVKASDWAKYYVDILCLDDDMSENGSMTSTLTDKNRTYEK